jgi:hypothetical protein
MSERFQAPIRWIISPALLVGLLCSAALAQSPKRHLLIFGTEQQARRHCSNDAVVWANTKSHSLYLPRDRHHHLHGGYACESTARELGYRAPRAHA